MKKIILLAFIGALFFAGNNANAQIRKIPSEVTNAFKAKYPSAANIEWKDKVTNFQGTFDMNGTKYEAKFTGKGEWISTEKTVDAASLPAAVHDGLKKSKYSDWEIKSSYIVYLPQEKTQYHIIAGKGDLERKNLLFDVNGQLQQDNLTLKN